MKNFGLFNWDIKFKQTRARQTVIEEIEKGKKRILEKIERRKKRNNRNRISQIEKKMNISAIEIPM